jgi:hypothetical protein
MDEVEQILARVAELLQNNIKKQLSRIRPSTTYGSPFRRGINKPVSGRYPTPFSAPISTGNLFRSVNVEWTGEFDEAGQQPQLTVDFGNANYWYWIDQGRKPNTSTTGTGVMKRALADWARVKPLPRYRDAKGRFITNEQRAFLITRSVAKYGYGGTNFLELAFEQTFQDIETEVGDASVAAILALIDQSGLVIKSGQNETFR